MNVAAPVIVPALVAGAIWLIAGRLWRRPPASTLVYGGALAVAVSFGAGHLVLMGWPPFPPVTAVHSLVYAGLIAGVVGVAEAGWRSHWALRWGIRALLALGAAWWQFKTLAEHSWTTMQTIGWLLTVTASIGTAWEALDTFAKRHPDIRTPLLFWMFACGASIGLVFGASAMLGQLAGCIAAACGAAVVLTIWSRNFPLDRGAAGLFAFITLGLLWQGYFYAALPLTSTCLLIVAPLTAFAIDTCIPSKTRTFYRLSAVFGGIIVTVGAAVVLAYIAYRAAAIEVGDYAY